MKKIFLGIFLLLAICCCQYGINKTQIVNAETQTKVFISQFEVSSKTYDSMVIEDVKLSFVDSENNKINLTKDIDYKLEYQKAGFTPKQEKPYTSGEYLAIVTPLQTSNYTFDYKTKSFNIFKANPFTIKVDYISICEGMELVKPTYEVIGTCYEKDLESIERTKTFYLLVNDEKISFEDLLANDLVSNEYELILEVSNNPNYQNVIIQNSKYVVNKKSINFVLNDLNISVSKPNGISFDYELYYKENTKSRELFDDRTKVELVFDLAYKNKSKWFNSKN